MFNAHTTVFDHASGDDTPLLVRSVVHMSLQAEDFPGKINYLCARSEKSARPLQTFLCRTFIVVLRRRVVKRVVKARLADRGFTICIMEDGFEIGRMYNTCLTRFSAFLSPAALTSCTCQTLP